MNEIFTRPVGFDDAPVDHEVAGVVLGRHLRCAQQGGVALHGYGVAAEPAGVQFTERVRVRTPQVGLMRPIAATKTCSSTRC